MKYILVAFLFLSQISMAQLKEHPFTSKLDYSDKSRQWDHLTEGSKWKSVYLKKGRFGRKKEIKNSEYIEFEILNQNRVGIQYGEKIGVNLSIVRDDFIYANWELYSYNLIIGNQDLGNRFYIEYICDSLMILRNYERWELSYKNMGNKKDIWDNELIRTKKINWLYYFRKEEDLKENQ